MNTDAEWVKELDWQLPDDTSGVDYIGNSWMLSDGTKQVILDGTFTLEGLKAIIKALEDAS